MEGIHTGSGENSGTNAGREMSECSTSAGSVDHTTKEIDMGSGERNQINIETLERNGSGCDEQGISIGMDKTVENGVGDVEFTDVNTIKLRSRIDEPNEIETCHEEKQRGDFEPGLQYNDSGKSTGSKRESEGATNAPEKGGHDQTDLDASVTDQRIIPDSVEANTSESRKEPDNRSNESCDIKTGKTGENISDVVESNDINLKERASDRIMEIDNLEVGRERSGNAKSPDNREEANSPENRNELYIGSSESCEIKSSNIEKMNESDIVECKTVKVNKLPNESMESDSLKIGGERPGEKKSTDNGEEAHRSHNRNESGIGSNESSEIKTGKTEEMIETDVVESDGVNMKELAPDETMEIDNLEVGGGGLGNDKLSDNEEVSKIIAVTELPRRSEYQIREDTLRWESFLKQLKQYKMKHGSCNVKSSNKRLYGWIYRQRRMQENGSLSEEKYKKLQDIGFDFEGEVKSVPSDSLKWNAYLKELKEYISKHGTSIVKSSGDQKQLCNWVHRQRSLHRRLKLPEEKYNKLIDIGFEFERDLEKAKGDIFERRMEELQKFKIKTGTTNVKYSENKSLYRWIVSQRKLYKKGILSVEKVDKLIDIGVVLEENDVDLKDGSYFTLPRANIPPLVITGESPLKISVYTHHIDELIDGLGNGQMKVEEAIERLKKMRSRT